MLKPLIDADVLRYEIGFSGQVKNESGEIDVLDFDFVADLLDNKIKYICEDVGATEAPTLYLTGSEDVISKRNKYNRLFSIPELTYLPNFREEISTTRKYKGTRKQEKPFHFNNLTWYILSHYDCKIANGMEADDDMCIDQFTDYKKSYKFFSGGDLEEKDSLCLNTIICSRDKDLRICPGLHYSWECGRQPSIGPTFTDILGSLSLRDNGKVLGYGLHFFYYQMLVGDVVDNIQGVPGIGPIKAFRRLCSGEKLDEVGLYTKTVEAYQEAFKEDWRVHFLEMANLLWMIQEIDEEGKPIMYKEPIINAA